MSSLSNVKITPGAVVCNESTLIGDISIGARTVIHPKAYIHAEDGPIFIGENNLIEEQVRIVNSTRENGDGTQRIKSDTTPVMIIGNNNVFEVDCKSYALKIGDNNILESKCLVGRSSQLSNGCVIGAACKLETEETLPENTVIFGPEGRRRCQSERPAPQTLQIDFLSKVLPNYHHLRKHTKLNQ